MESLPLRRKHLEIHTVLSFGNISWSQAMFLITIKRARNKLHSRFGFLIHSTTSSYSRPAVLSFNYTNYKYINLFLNKHTSEGNSAFECWVHQELDSYQWVLRYQFYIGRDNHNRNHPWTGEGYRWASQSQTGQDWVYRGNTEEETLTLHLSPLKNQMDVLVNKFIYSNI